MSTLKFKSVSKVMLQENVLKLLDKYNRMCYYNNTKSNEG